MTFRLAFGLVLVDYVPVISSISTWAPCRCPSLASRPAFLTPRHTVHHGRAFAHRIDRLLDSGCHLTLYLRSRLRCTIERNLRGAATCKGFVIQIWATVGDLVMSDETPNQNENGVRTSEG